MSTSSLETLRGRLILHHTLECTQFFTQTNQEGIECTKTKEQLRSYCPNIHTVFAGLDINLASLTQTVAKTEADLFVKSSFHPKMLILTQKETEMTVSNQFINFNFYLAMTDPRSQRPKQHRLNKRFLPRPNTTTA